MILRSLLALGLFAGLVASSEAATVTKLVVRCVDQQEVSPDDVFLAGTRDGQPVPWSKDNQEGASKDRSINLTTGGNLTLDSGSLGHLKFEKTLQIAIKEKDVTTDEVLGTLNITPDDGSKTVKFQGDGFVYEVEYTVQK